MAIWFLWFIIIAAFFAADYLRGDLVFSRYHQPLFYNLLVLFVIVFAGFRYQVGNDYDNYARLYDVMATNPLSTYMEPGYAFFCYFLNLLGLSFQGMFLLFSTVTILLISMTLKRYSVHPALSFMIFLLVPAYYFNTLCIVRQFFAMAVVFACLPYIIDRKFWKFLFFVTIVATFHKSAVIAIPFYFLATLKINRFVMLALLVLVIVFPPGQLLNHLFLLKDYDEYLSSQPPEFGIGLTLIFRIAVFIFVLFARERFDDRNNRIITNIYLLGVVFYFATLKTEALSRVALYLTLFEIIAIVNTFYLFVRTDRIRMAIVYVSYCTLLFFQNLNNYGKLYKRDTSEGNINYEINLKLINKKR